MSILISPSDNTGWGVGNSKMRATGVNFTLRQPVKVKSHYRAQWGQRNGKKGLDKLKVGLRNYLRKYLSNKKKRKSNKSLMAYSNGSVFTSRVLTSALRSVMNGKKRRSRRRK
ncbi:pVII protein [Amniota adenovirus 1]|nr:pVII protein [Amniota adenovirus 1]